MDSEHQIEIERAARQAVREELDSEMGDRRYINLERVPLICQSIIRIDQNIEELKARMVTQDSFFPVRNLMYGMVGLILSGVVGALLMLVLR